MSHRAFDVEPVLSNVSSFRVACIESWGDRLIVADSDGCIHVYERRVHDRRGEGADRTKTPRHSFIEIQRHSNFARKIEQIATFSIYASSAHAVPGDTSGMTYDSKQAEGQTGDGPQKLELLITICEACIRIHDLPTFHQRDTLDKTRGCYLFALNRKHVVGKSSSSLRIFHSAPLWLCVCIKRKLLLCRWERNSFQHTAEINLGHSPRTLRWLGEDSLCVGFVKDYVIVNAITGAAVDVCSVGRRGRPLMAVLPGREVLVIAEQRGVILSFDGKRARPSSDDLIFPETPLAVSFAQPYYIVACFPNRLIIQSLSTRTVLQQFPLERISFIANAGHLFRDPRLADAHPENLFIASARGLFFLASLPLDTQLDQLVHLNMFKEALSLVSASVAVNAEREEMLDAFAHVHLLTEGSDFEWERRKQQRMNHIHQRYAYHLFNEGKYDQAMMFFQQIDCDPRQILSLFPVVLPTGQCKGIAHPVDVNPIEGEEQLKSALSALIPFLVRTRVLLARSQIISGFGLKRTDGDGEGKDEPGATEDLNAPNLREMSLPVLMDTVLLKAYLLTDENYVCPFLEAPNHCDIEESQNVLRVYEKFPELVALYRTRGYHHEALELLRQLGQSSRVNNPLHGTEPTVKYLQTLAEDPRNTGLVLDFSRWVLKANPDQGLRIFTHAHRHSSNGPGLNPALVLEHLKSAADAEVCIAHLESLIRNTGETGSAFHNELIIFYLNGVLQALRERGDVDAKAPYVPAGKEPGRLGILRARLLAFLEDSQFFEPTKMLSKFPRFELLEERAVLLSRIGQHTQALAIYANKLRAPALAEAYCKKFWDQDPTEGKKVYSHLLRVYLHPAPGEAPMIGPALALLQKHNQHIDPKTALRLLPANTPVHELLPYLHAILSGSCQHRKNSQVVKYLRRAENLQTRLQVLNARRAHVYVGHDTLCSHCHKRLGKSAFARYPDSTVVHYICSEARRPGRVLSDALPEEVMNSPDSRANRGYSFL